MKKIAELAINEEFKITGGFDEVVNIMNTEEVINFHCFDCDTTMSFKQYDKHIIVDSNIGSLNIYKFHSITLNDDVVKLIASSSYGSPENTVKVNNNTQYYFIINFLCPQKSCYTNITQIFSFSNDTIKKVYQNFDDETINIKFINELSKNTYLSKQDKEELLIADRLHKQGYHIASYVYLRRVNENIFNGLYEKNKSNITINGKYPFEQLPTKDKVKLLNNYLPVLFSPEESNNKYTQIYKILSEVIHKLDESTAANFYKLLRQIIIKIVEDIKNKEKNEKDVSNIASVYNVIFNANN